MTSRQRKLKPYLFYISPELDAGLKTLKARTGAPEGESIRRALAAYLRKHGVLKPAGKPAGRRATR